MKILCGAIGEESEFDEFFRGGLPLHLPVGRCLSGMFQPDAGIESLKSRAHMNDAAVARWLHVENVDEQQAMGVDLRALRRHRSNDGALGFDLFVVAEADEVSEGLAGLQFWEKVLFGGAAPGWRYGGGNEQEREKRARKYF